jgi:hypothetical protein
VPYNLAKGIKSGNMFTLCYDAVDWHCHHYFVSQLSEGFSDIFGFTKGFFEIRCFGIKLVSRNDYDYPI